jgi:hypothetical protein
MSLCPPRFTTTATITVTIGTAMEPAVPEVSSYCVECAVQAISLHPLCGRLVFVSSGSTSANDCQGEGWVHFEWLPEQQDVQQPFQQANSDYQQSAHSQYLQQPQLSRYQSRVDSAQYSQPPVYFDSIGSYSTPQQAGSATVISRLGSVVRATYNAEHLQIVEQQLDPGMCTARICLQICYSNRSKTSRSDPLVSLQKEG